jgi:glutamate carboxypeptidase
LGVAGGGTPATIDDQGLSIASSGKTNIVAQTAIARGDIRSLTPDQDARVRARMVAIVSQNLPGTSATIGTEL